MVSHGFQGKKKKCGLCHYYCMARRLFIITLYLVNLMQDPHQLVTDMEKVSVQVVIALKDLCALKE